MTTPASYEDTPAFPIVHPDGKGVQYYGMTLRDYLAAKALQGYLANAWQSETLDSLGESAAQQIATVAEISYAMADAMLAERAK